MFVINENKFDISVLNRLKIENNISEFLNYFKKQYNLTSKMNGEEKYFDVLNKFQNNSIEIKQGGINIRFANEDELEFLKEMKVIESSNAKCNNNTDYDKINKIIKESLKLISVLNSGLSNVIRQLVGTIIIVNKGDFSSATVPSKLGVIFLNPTINWRVVDYAEAIYHEFIHLSLFLEDMIHSLYVNIELCQSEDALVKSVIRGEKRPLDRSFHAAIVSIGIMHLYYMIGNSKKSNQYMENLESCLEELNTKAHFFEDRGKEILNNMNLFIKNKDFENISVTLNN